MKFDNPESRVRAFIADYYLQWQAAQKYMGDFRALKLESMERWAMECEALDRRHYAADAVPANTDDSYSSPPDHHAEQEQITKTQSDGETAVVQTRRTGDLRTIRVPPKTSR